MSCLNQVHVRVASFADTTTSLARRARLSMGAGLLFYGLFFVLFVLGCSGGKSDTSGAEDSARATPSPASSDSITFDTSTREALGPPMPFPSVSLTALDGKTVDAASLVQGKYSIVMFIKIGCEACAEVLDVWKEVQPEFPPEMNVFAVTKEEPDYARDYVEESGFPFTLYCDEKGVFEKQYGLVKYPAVVGVGDDGRVAYVGKPVTPEFTPRKAWKLLVEVVTTRRAKEAEGGAAAETPERKGS